MYRFSKNIDNVVQFPKLLHGHDKIRLKFSRLLLESYRGSPLHRGVIDWDFISAETLNEN